MICLKEYNDKTQTILGSELKEVKLKIEYGFKQHLITLDRIATDSFDLDIKNEGFNPHLKEVYLSFENNLISSELLNIFNDKNHIVINVKMNFPLFDLNDCNTDNDKTLELEKTIMYIDNIEITNNTMKVYLRGHMVV